MSAPTATRAKRRRKKAEPIKLDVACGQNKQDGFTGIDIAPVEGVDVVHDLTVYPWPFDDDSVGEVFCSHYVEHTPTDVGGVDGLIAFMNELHRIMAAGAQARIVHPFARSDRAFQDPTHRRFIPDATWAYFNRDWRELNGLNHYPITADFQVTNISASLNPPWDSRATEAQQFAIAHYWNVVSDLVVDLRAVK